MLLTRFLPIIYIPVLASCCGEVRVKGGSTLIIRRPAKIKAEASTRIIGGSRASLGAWPWQAFIEYTDSADGEIYICGGTLISSKHILTAAHCAVSMNENRTRIRLGAVDVSTQSTQGLLRNVSSKLLHPQYNGDETANPSQLFDIALLTLSSEVPFSDVIQPICLPTTNYKSISDFAYVTGFGAYNNATKILPIASAYLKQTAVPVIDKEVCSDKWEDELEDYGGGFRIDDSQICAGAVGIGSAQGDSGGPLVQLAPDGRWYQIGIVSFGVNSGKGYYDQAFAPGIYTSVSAYCEFFHSATEGTVQCENTQKIPEFPSSHSNFAFPINLLAIIILFSTVII